MAYRVSILEKALIPPGETPAATLDHALAAAVRADQLGYHRYWFAEHHGIDGLASSAPETLAAFVLARTKSIRVGTGGVMLQHYAPYKVAETFNLLAALARGRVDLGIGRAPGGLPHATRALRSNHDTSDFPEKLAELDAFLTGARPDNVRFAHAVATPMPDIAPQRILLGASVESARLAARLDWDYCYAGHFDGDPGRIAQVFDTYRRATGRTPLLALVAFAAATEAEAKRHVGQLRLYRVRLSTGQTVNVSSPELAAEFARQAEVADYSTEEIVPNVLAGTADQVRAELDRLHDELGVEEFVIDTPVPGFAERRVSLEALAPHAAASTHPRAVAA
ncbi:MsnO8 family LLM class oxidoreductase [Sphingomonas sp.]|uniref:MsnO8 family LLM class oxidoreductase n=1 Tax=Sphingomonas sp. TaxID=28214 RepID=UPI002DD6559C|nr:MsnO8 family LLM class oxidoreductase [Sphingomonas sp.]